MVLNSKVVGPTLQFLDVNFFYGPHKVTKIVDLGAGEGWLSYWLRKMVKDSLIGPYKTQIDAIELFDGFIPALKKQYYSNVFHEDITLFYEKFVNYDLIISLECIEHITKDKIIPILKYLLAHNKFIFLSTPNGFTDGGEHEGNPYQKHQTGFTKEDAKALGLKYKIIDTQLYMYSKELKWHLHPWFVRLRRKLLPAKIRKLLI